MKNYLIDKLVRIEGTMYDRRRKLSESQITRIKSEYANGASMSSLAKKYSVTYNTIHYHVDEEYKEFHNQRRSTSTRSTGGSSSSRIAYKKTLLKNYFS